MMGDVVYKGDLKLCESPVMWEWPLVVSVAKFMAWIRDIAPPKERLPDAPTHN